MHLTQYTDYSLRVLIFLGLKGDLATVSEIATAFRISRNHLVKIVHELSQRSYIESFKGKNGGIRLARSPQSIQIGDFVKELETMNLVECFDKNENTCPIIGVCQLEKALYEARNAFVDSLNQLTLDSFLQPGPAMTQRLKRLGISKSQENSK